MLLIVTLFVIMMHSLITRIAIAIIVHIILNNVNHNNSSRSRIVIVNVYNVIKKIILALQIASFLETHCRITPTVL